MGLWRTYSALDPHITSSGDTFLTSPSRLVLPHAPYGAIWDEAGINHIVLHGAFPSLSVEYSDDWSQRGSTNRPYILDRTVLTARTAACRGKDFGIDDKIVAIANRLPGSVHWWSPVRKNVLEFAERGKLDTAGRRPVITYISRQGRGRALAQDDHLSLVDALEDLETRYGYEVHIVIMEELSKLDQIRLAGRTTVS